MGSLLRLLVMLEASLLIIGILVMAVETARRRRTERRIGAVRHRITERTDEARLAGLAEELRALPPRESVALLADLATQLVGPERTRLADLARRAGLLNEAQRWQRSRHWRRRLYGTQVQAALGRGDQDTASMLHDPHPLVRAEAARAAGSPMTPATCRALVEMLDDGSLACRLAAKDALLRSGEDATGAIAGALAENDGTPHSTVALIEVASRRRDPSTLGSIIERTGDADPSVRAAAVRGLGRLGGPGAHRAVVAARNDPDLMVRIAALEAMGNIGATDDAATIVSGVYDENWEARRTSAIALSKLGAVGRLQLRRIARTADGPAAETARWILDAAGSTGAFAVGSR